MRRRFLPLICLLFALSCVRIGRDEPAAVEDTSRLLSMNYNQEVALFRGEDSTIVFRALIKDPSKLRLDVVTNGDCANLEYNPVEGTGSLSVHCPIIDGDKPVVVEMKARYGGTFKTYVVGLRLKTMALDVGDLYFESGDEETKRVFSWVKANYADYTLSVTSDVDWIVISDDQGTVRVLQNETDELRTGHISVLDDTGRFSSGILVSQEPAMRYKDGCVFFRDRRFKKAVLAVYDEDGDSELSFDEACRVRRLELSGLDIRNLAGIEEMKGIQYLDVSHNQIDSTDFSDYEAFYDLRYIDLRGNSLTRCRNEVFGNAVNFGGCYEGPSFKGYADIGSFRETKYYSPAVVFDGAEVVCLQEHSKGNGLFLLFADYSVLDKAYTNGAAREIYESWMEKVFSCEPFKSFRDYFSVYYYVVCAKNTKTLGSVNPSKDTFMPSHRYSHYCTFVRKTDHNSVNGHLLSTGNATGCASQMGYSDYFILANDGYSCSWVELSERDMSSNTILHELGHAIGSLGDEYDLGGVSVSRLSPNVSICDDLGSSPWKKFASIEKYANRVGIYRRGSDDAYVPSQKSIMACNANVFNTPSRFAIFKTIYWCSHAKIADFNTWIRSIDSLGPSEEEMWEAFLEYDTINDDIPI